MTPARLGGMPAAIALSFAIHAAALAGGLLLVRWERPAGIEAISVELVALPDKGSADASIAGRSAPRPEAEREPVTELQPVSVAAVSPEAAVAVAPPEEARPVPPPEVEAIVPVADTPVMRLPVPRAKPAPPEPAPRTLVARPESPPPAEPAPLPTAAAPAVQAGDEGGTNGGAGPARGLEREAASLPGNPPPAYPLGARRRGIEGRVILRLSVASSGAVADAAVRQSSGHAMLDAAALEAVKRWRFRPALRGGRPADTMIDVPITFRLDE